MQIWTGVNFILEKKNWIEKIEKSVPVEKNSLLFTVKIATFAFTKMNTAVFEALANSSISWICCNCGFPNYSSSLFHSFSCFVCKNSFDKLQNLPDQDRTPSKQSC